MQPILTNEMVLDKNTDLPCIELQSLNKGSTETPFMKLHTIDISELQSTLWLSDFWMV
jgi:hypothetical protein